MQAKGLDMGGKKARLAREDPRKPAKKETDIRPLSMLKLRALEGGEKNARETVHPV